MRADDVVAWLRYHRARLPAWAIDAAWTVAVAVAVSIAIRVAQEPNTRRPDLLAYALGVTIGAMFEAVAAPPEPGSSSPAIPSLCPTMGRAGAANDRQTPVTNGQQR